MTRNLTRAGPLMAGHQGDIWPDVSRCSYPSAFAVLIDARQGSGLDQRLSGSRQELFIQAGYRDRTEPGSAPQVAGDQQTQRAALSRPVAACRYLDKRQCHPADAKIIQKDER